ncbi:MAG: translation initiation factor 1 [Candidatus Binatia bacterium]|jgi:translation initiation factor 1
MPNRVPVNSRAVYSTVTGTLCPECGRSKVDCSCKTAAAVPKNDGIVRVGRQTKGRKGKGVTTITGVPLVGAELEALAKQLKNRCGAGGGLREAIIEIQGDHRDTVVAELKNKGWTIKRAGG